jgi:hypothetical protein
MGRGVFAGREKGMQEREFWKFGERYFRKQRLDRYVEELSKAKDEKVMAHKDSGVILGTHQSRMETHPRWYRETWFIQNAVYWLCCEGGPESRYECNDGRADNIPLEPEDALNWLETNGFEEQADTLLAIKRNGLLHPGVDKAMKGKDWKWRLKKLSNYARIAMKRAAKKSKWVMILGERVTA